MRAVELYAFDGDEAFTTSEKQSIYSKQIIDIGVYPTPCSSLAARGFRSPSVTCNVKTGMMQE